MWWAPTSPRASSACICLFRAQWMLFHQTIDWHAWKKRHWLFWNWHACYLDLGRNKKLCAVFLKEATPAVARFSKSVALNICRGLEVWKLLIRWHQATGSMSTSGMENLRDVDDSGTSVYCCVFARGADQHLRQSIGCGKWQVVMCSKFFQLCTACMFCIILCIVTTQAFHTQKIRVDLWVIIYVWVSSKPSRVPNMLTDLLKSETIRFQNST